ncbi:MULTISPECIES: GNAT family N-acetyltransferase [Pseudoalteromonas]|jgi:putative acetyltransferase|uniref:Acetyltransferase n=1 Tax=Pseudoalteromonas aliena SW19 TaxID=1314866 RepID=A0ABR9E1X5_9GAMM|nr:MULTISPECIES: GNAT family N-acetyltransferase [Pseudoalteromonas]MBE0360383.1 putative acetyltransferase [Pseudoalteromonas aliena SW19]
MDIRTGELSNPHVIKLLQAHHNDMLKHSPVESVHALDVTKLNQPDITFYSLWVDNKLAGVGALKALNTTHGEVKSMRTSSNYLRQGIAAKLFTHIIKQSTLRGYKKLSLETGTVEAFLPAQKLYTCFGFKECEPFGDYELDPYSLFMSKAL